MIFFFKLFCGYVNHYAINSVEIMRTERRDFFRRITRDSKTQNFSPEEIRPYYLLADICIVSSLHDGMNLVAKEYVAAKSDLNGTLILSKFTGAARELTDALQINPYSIEEFADTIKLAVEMPEVEKKKRMENMRKVVGENNVYRWAGNIITELTTLKKG